MHPGRNLTRPSWVILGEYLVGLLGGYDDGFTARWMMGGTMVGGYLGGFAFGGSVADLDCRRLETGGMLKLA